MKTSRNSGKTLRTAACGVGVVVVMVGVVMGQVTKSGEEDREKWDRRYGGPEFVYGSEPVRFLVDNADLLPARGRALDVAAGEGRNSVFLARRGLDVDAVDISEVGLAKARVLADEAGVQIRTIVADLNQYEIARGAYDVVVVINYLQRDLMDDLKAALKPGGLIYYQTFTTGQLDIPGAHPVRRPFLLDPGELQSIFEDFEIVQFHERSTDRRAVASLIARKPLEP